MKRKTFFIISFGICIFSTILFAKQKLSLSLDAAQFSGQDKQSYLEIYYSIPENGPVYIKNKTNTFETSLLMNLLIFQKDSLWATKTWRLDNTIADTTSKEDKKQLVDMLRYPVAAKKSYNILLYVRDLNSGRLDSANVECTGMDFTGERLLLSDLQLASSITPYDSTCSKVFQKRIYCITPNPEMTFGSGSTILYYYFEIYNILLNIIKGPLYVQNRILDNYGNVCQQVPENKQYKKVRQDVSREMGQFDIGMLPSGIYELQSIVSDSSRTFSAKVQKSFLVRNPSIKIIAQNITNVPLFNYQYLEGMAEVMLDKEFDKMFAIVSKKDRDMYRNFKQAEGKKNYLYQLWASLRNPEFSNAEDFRIDYLTKARYVETTFKSTFKPAWRTDQGIIYLRYGKPSDIERYPNSDKNLPHEIWQYEQIEGGVIFIFVDRMGVGRYELIHSTKRGELYDPNWERQLAPVADSNIRM